MNRSAVTAVIVSMLSCTCVLAESPNIVIFYADDMGIGDVGAYGCPDIKTPSIDALASSGVRFTNYYSAAPICSPSRAALLTGRYPIHAGVPTNVGSTPGSSGLQSDQLTIAEVAKTKGYATAAIGKWHLGFIHDQQPNSQGFDLFFGHHAGCIDYYSHTFYWHGQAPNHHDLYRNRTEIHEDGQYFTHLITREAKAFIDQNKDGPFLLYVPFNAPHYPMQAPQRYWEPYKHLEKKRQRYAALLTAMDEAIGHIVGHLDKNNLTDNTLIFFMSDNGISRETRAFGGGGSSGPYRESKFSLFEGGIHMPGIVVWPGKIPAGETRDQMTCAIDVLPTVAEVIGAKTPKDYAIDGTSWLPLLKDAAAPSREALYWSWNNQDAVREGKWKLVRNGIMTLGMSKQERSAGDDLVFLSNLEDDPGETKNLATDQPELVKKLLNQHANWKKRVSQ